jgi:hypothetical protein
MRASVHKITNDCFRVSFTPTGFGSPVAEVLVTSGGKARNIKRTYDKYGEVSQSVVGQIIPVT